MFHGSSTAIIHPDFQDKCSEGFRIGDVRRKGLGFLKTVAQLAPGGAPGIEPDTRDADLDCTDLRLQTEEEALESALRHSGIAPLNGQQASPAIDFRPHENGAGVNGVQGKMARAQEAYANVVSAIREKRAAARTDASRFLRSLQAHDAPSGPTSSTSSKPVGLTSTSLSSKILQANLQGLDGSSIVEENRGGTGPDAAVASDEVVVHIAIHVPQAPGHVSEEWLVLGSQSLTELRDHVFCLTEENIRNVERDENTRVPPGASGLALDKRSAYFYIEGTFYIDKRKCDAVDYSQVIRMYAQGHNIPAPPHPPPAAVDQALAAATNEFSISTMESTTFEDLWVRLGAPALYCHQAGCEHMLVFHDVRAFDRTTDPPLRSHYPARLASPRCQQPQRRNCEACGLRFAKKLTYDDKCTPHTPFFWCDDCFRLMHYDASGRALYTDFRVFPYRGEYTMLAQFGGRRVPTAASAGALSPAEHGLELT